MKQFVDFLTENKVDFKIAVPYPDDAEWIQQELKKLGIKAEVRHKNAVSYIMGKVKDKQKDIDYLDDLAREYDGDLFLG